MLDKHMYVSIFPLMGIKCRSLLSHHVRGLLLIPSQLLFKMKFMVLCQKATSNQSIYVISYNNFTSLINNYVLTSILKMWPSEFFSFELYIPSFILIYDVYLFISNCTCASYPKHIDCKIVEYFGHVYCLF